MSQLDGQHMSKISIGMSFIQISYREICANIPKTEWKNKLNIDNQKNKQNRDDIK